MKITVNLLTVMGLVVSACATASVGSLETVQTVNLDQYLGKWHEMMRISNSFQDRERDGLGACKNTIAEYATLPKGRISVTNTCIRYDQGLASVDKTATSDGVAEVARAIARVVKNSGNSKLKVNFTGIAFLRWLGIGDGKYWIYALGDLNQQNQYAWALVGSPKKDFGWILARDPNINPQEIDKILKIAQEKGFDIRLFESHVKQ